MSSDLLLPPLRVLLLGSALIAIGALGFNYIPGMISDDAPGTRWVNAFYCSVITLTTVGYGDICPSAKTTPIGHVFIVLLTFSGLGMFCGPIMDVTSSWRNRIPGGLMGVALATLGLGIGIFTVLEGMSNFEAAYFTIITGTTIGYGDITPTTDQGKIATALFAILVVNVVGVFLEPAKEFLSRLCATAVTGSATETDNAVRDEQFESAQKKED